MATKAPAKVFKGVKPEISWRIITDRASGVASCTIEEDDCGGAEDGVLYWKTKEDLKQETKVQLLLSTHHWHQWLKLRSENHSAHFALVGVPRG